MNKQRIQSIVEVNKQRIQSVVEVNKHLIPSAVEVNKFRVLLRLTSRVFDLRICNARKKY